MGVCAIVFIFEKTLERLSAEWREDRERSDDRQETLMDRVIENADEMAVAVNEHSAAIVELRHAIDGLKRDRSSDR